MRADAPARVGQDPLAPLLLTFGLSIVLQNLLLEIFTANTRSLQAGDLALRGFNVAGVSVGVLPFVSTLAMVLVNWPTLVPVGPMVR